MPALHPIFLPEPSSTVYEQDVLTALPQDTTGTILTYTNSGGDNLYVDRVSAEGEVDARFAIFVDTDEKDAKRSSGGQYTVDWQFPGGGLILAAGSILEVKVEHGLPVTADFSATLFGHRF